MCVKPFTLYVGGLPPETDSEALAKIFVEYGELVAARVVMRPSTSTCRGFCYVTFVTDRAAAIDNYNTYIAKGGPYSDAARAGVARLNWVPAK